LVQALFTILDVGSQVLWCGASGGTMNSPLPLATCASCVSEVFFCGPGEAVPPAEIPLATAPGA
jgi:hypothetical protein